MTEKYTEIEGVEVNQLERFPFSGVKVAGGIQIGLGSICIALGFVDIILYVFVESNYVPPTIPPTVQPAYDTLITLTITSAPIWCGLWFCVTGSMAACMSENRKSTLYYFKITFLVLSILCATVFGPVCLIISAIVASMRHTLDADNFRWLVPILTAFFSLNEIIFAVVSASICCCCSPVRTSKVRVLLAQETSSKEKPDDDLFTVEPMKEKELSRDSVDMFTTSDRYGKPLPAPVHKPDRPDTKDSISSYAKLKRLALPSTYDHTF